MWIVRFQMVTPTDHPEHYCTVHDRRHPRVLPDDVPAGHWRTVTVTHLKHPDAVAQFRGLNALIRRRELVRDVHLSRVSDAQFLSVGEDDPQGQEEQCDARPDDGGPQQDQQ